MGSQSWTWLREWTTATITDEAVKPSMPHPVNKQLGIRIYEYCLVELEYVSSCSMTFLPYVDGYGGTGTFSGTGIRHSFPCGYLSAAGKNLWFVSIQSAPNSSIIKRKSSPSDPTAPRHHTHYLIQLRLPCGVFLSWLPLMMIGTLFLRDNHVSDERKGTQGGFFP